MASRRSARALVVELVADVKEFVKGTQQADDALSDFVRDAERDLDKLDDARPFKDFGRDADRDLDKVGRSAKEAADDAERAFDNLAREAKRSFDKIGRESADAMDVDRSFGEAGTEAGSEFAANMSETLSSGDFTGLGRDTAAGLVSGFASLPGWGAALAPLAGAAALVFADIAKKAENAAELTQQAFENFGQGAMEALQQTLRGQQFQTILEQMGGGTAFKGMQKLLDLTKKAGVSAVDFKEALVAGGTPLDQQKARLQEIVKRGQAIQSNWRTANTETAKAARAAQKLLEQTNLVDDSIEAGAESASVLNSKLGDKAAASAVAVRSQKISQQRSDMNSMELSQRRINNGYTDPRINRAIEERTRLLGLQERTASRAAAAVRGAPGTVVGGRALGQ